MTKPATYRDDEAARRALRDELALERTRDLDALRAAALPILGRRVAIAVSGGVLLAGAVVLGVLFVVSGRPASLLAPALLVATVGGSVSAFVALRGSASRRLDEHIAASVRSTDDVDRDLERLRGTDPRALVRERAESHEVPSVFLPMCGGLLLALASILHLRFGLAAVLPVWQRTFGDDPQEQRVSLSEWHAQAGVLLAAACVVCVLEAWRFCRDLSSVAPQVAPHATPLHEVSTDGLQQPWKPPLSSAWGGLRWVGGPFLGLPIGTCLDGVLPQAWGEPVALYIGIGLGWAIAYVVVPRVERALTERVRTERAEL